MYAYGFSLESVKEKFKASSNALSNRQLQTNEYNKNILNDTMVDTKQWMSKIGQAKTIANTFFEREMTVNERVMMILNKRKLLDVDERLFLLKYAGDTETTHFKHPFMEKLGNIGLGLMVSELKA